MKMNSNRTKEPIKRGMILENEVGLPFVIDRVESITSTTPGGLFVVGETYRFYLNDGSSYEIKIQPCDPPYIIEDKFKEIGFEILSVDPEFKDKPFSCFQNKMDFNIYPLTIIKDRYNGTYSGYKYLAFNQTEDKIPKEIFGDDVECGHIWGQIKSGNILIDYGAGATPDTAFLDLWLKINHINIEDYIPDYLTYIIDDNSITLKYRSGKKLTVTSDEANTIRDALCEMESLKAMNNIKTDMIFPGK